MRTNKINMNNTVPIARAMLLIFIVSIIGACSSTKSLYSKEYLMTHNDTTVYDNVYLVDTIEIPNPRVISLYPLWGKSEYSFVADSALAMKIVEEMQRLHTWSDFFKYLGLSTLNPSLHIANSFNPTSTPIFLSTGFSCSISVSTNIEI